LQAFEKNLEANLGELARNLLNKTYEPLPARYVNISKPNGTQRELAIPCVRDRVTQRAVLDLIEPMFEPQFLDCSYAFRPGRSVEMAVEKIIVARAHGLRWTAHADVQDFFPSINHNLLEELSGTLDDADILGLINLWLDSGVFDGARPKARWIVRWRQSLAGANLAVRDAVNELVDEFLQDRFGVTGEPDFVEQYAEQPEIFDELAEQNLTESCGARRKSGFGRAALRRLVQDGLLLALAERAALKSMRAAKIIGIGGAAFALAAVTPAIVRKLKAKVSPKTGASQGAPISPILSNIYLHPFDRVFSGQGHRLIRYCDDFVILCRSRAEADESLRLAEATIRERQLRLSRDKTRLVSPAEAFDFLGYRFNPDGSIIPPPSVPEVVTRRVIEIAARYGGRASRQVSSTMKKTGSVVAKIRARMKGTNYE
jgi:RNA-directed DNA polymerase